MSTPDESGRAAGPAIGGFSLAGEETYVVVPELNLAFDVGRAPREVLAVDHIFLSHGHMDHSAGLAYYFSQRMFLDNAPGTVYVPRGLEEPIRRLLRVWADIDGHEPAANIVVAEPQVDIELRRDLVVRPFDVNHPCRRHDGSVVRGLGFCAIDVRRKLRPQFEGLSGPEIVEAKRRGEDVTRRVEFPLIAYCGDTAPGDFLQLDYVRQAQTLVLECTFFDAEHVSRARHGNHMHVRDLAAIVPRLENERIVLTHVSRRTALAEARAMLRRELGDRADRISFLMELRRRGRARSRPDGAS